MIVRFFRRCLLTLGFLSLLPLAAGLVAYLWRGGSVPDHSILHVTFDGSIDEAPQSSVAALWRDGGSGHLAELTHKLRAAAADSRIVGLLLEVKEPKVGLAQLEELGRAVAEFRKSGKWSASYLEDTGETGGGDGAFALACLAKEVVLSPPGELRLSGLHAEVPFVAKTLQRLAIDAHVEQRYEYKNYANTFTQTAFTPAHKASMASLLDDMQKTLLDHVARGRGVRAEDVAAWVEAAPFHSQAAKARGLVDRLGYWDEVVQLVEQVAGHEDALVAIEDYTPRPPRTEAVDVAYVVGAGEIGRGHGGYSPTASDTMAADVYVEALRQAREDKVRGVLLRLDTPGGSYLASDLIRREVERTRAEKIPVVVSMGNTAASGGYFIAAEADYVVAEAGTVTGSIGVVGASFAVGRALDQFIGVTFDRYSALPNPGTLSFIAPPNAAQAARLGADIDRVYNEFVSKVAQGRHKSFAEVHALAKGRVWTGRQAVAQGLADELGGIDTAMAYLGRRLDLPEGARLALQHYPPPKTTLELVREAVDMGMQAGGVRRMGRTLLHEVARQALREASVVRPAVPMLTLPTALQGAGQL